MSDPEMTQDPSEGGLDPWTFWQEARDLIKRVEGSSVQRVAIAIGDFKVEIERAFAASVEAAAPTPLAAALPTAPVVDGGGAAAAAVEDERHRIVAPLVGTFYRAPQPGAKPFVEEGDVIDEGQTVGIVEAMKLMNQVQADQAGRVAEIVTGDGEWVEFEQVLMYLEPIR